MNTLTLPLTAPNLNVAVLATYLGREQAGAAQATLAIINALARTPGIRTTVFAYRADPALLDPNVTLIIGREPPSRRFLWRVSNLLAPGDAARSLAGVDLGSPDLVYTQNLALALAWRRLHPDSTVVVHTGAVITSREVLEEDIGMPPIFRRLGAKAVDLQERNLYRQKRVVNLVSTALVARQREEYFHLPGGFFRICPYGVDTERFCRDADYPDVRRDLGIPASATVVISVARLVAWKNVRWVVDAVARLSSDVYLVVVGDGPEAGALREHAAASPAASRIRFVGRTDPAPYLAASDVFALPSAIESFGMVYAEAMLMGLPCIGLRNEPPRVLSSAQDVIPEGQAGHVVGSPDELAVRL